MRADRPRAEGLLDQARARDLAQTPRALAQLAEMLGKTDEARSLYGQSAREEQGAARVMEGRVLYPWSHVNPCLFT